MKTAQGTLLIRNGTLILKFFLHMSKTEQRKRLLARLDEPAKNWKFEIGDLDERHRWNDYVRAYEDMLNATSHPAARWHLVPADRKWYRDLVVARATVHALEALKLKWPKPREDLSKIKIR